MCERVSNYTLLCDMVGAILRINQVCWKCFNFYLFLMWIFYVKVGLTVEWFLVHAVWILFSFLANVNSRSRSLYAISRPFVVCLLSVCLSVCDVGAPYSGGWTFRQFFSSYDSPGTLLFWCQKLLVGDAPFPLKFAFKVTHPLSNSEISTNIGS